MGTFLNVTPAQGFVPPKRILLWPADGWRWNIVQSYGHQLQRNFYIFLIPFQLPSVIIQENNWSIWPKTEDPDFFLQFPKLIIITLIRNLLSTLFSIDKYFCGIYLRIFISKLLYLINFVILIIKIDDWQFDGWMQGFTIRIRTFRTKGSVRDFF